VTDSDQTQQMPPATEELAATPTERRIADLEAALATTEQQSKEYLDGWQRERAAFANYRRRADEERGSIAQVATEELVCRLLPLVDDLDRACAEMPPDAANTPWGEGVQLVQRKFHQFLSSLGVEPIEATGKKFDPSQHEAVTHEESHHHEEGEVIEEVLKGYRMGDHVLRCSVVRVAKQPN